MLEEIFVYNKDAIMLYKDTETRFANDAEVDADDLVVMCNMLYQTELMTVFGIINKEEKEEEKEPDFDSLTHRIEALYVLIKSEPRIIDMVQQHFFQDDLLTFLSLFSYDTFYLIHKLICECL